MVIFLATALTLLPPVTAAPVYSLTIFPSVPVNQGTTLTLTLSITGGANNQAYSVVIGVTKPNGTGQASTTRTIGTNNKGAGSVTLYYPDPSFTPTNGTVNTDVGGVYTVTVNQTAPSFVPSVATGQFTVISNLTIVLSQPSPFSYVQRGQVVTIVATISSPNGPVNTATAYANTPPNGRVYLQQVGNGVYSVNYQVQLYDPLGLWTIQVTASSPGENTGLSNTANVTITRSDIVVEGLTAYNAKGDTVSSFSPGDNIVPFFRIKYSNGVYITTGQFRVAIKDPSGREIANLTALYENSKFGFDVSSGYLISAYDPAGSWTIAIDAGTASDSYGNTGPDFTTSLTVQVVTITSPWGYLPFVIGGMAAVLSGIVVAKKYGKSVSGFEHMEQLMGGPIPRASSVLILGDPGSGKSILSYQFLYDELENGHYCALLSYDVFPEDVQARMKEFGWEITSHLRKNRLKIVDCYSGLAGEGEGAIKDPSDLTELNIRVTSIITRAKGSPVTLALDSLTPIFNGVEGKQAIMFLQTVAAKIKKTGGIFYMTGSPAAIPSDSLSKVRSMTEGLIELSMVREHRKVSRFLTVVKMERRKISSEAVPFTIDRRKGIVFQVSRLRSTLLRKPDRGPSSLPATPPQEKPTTGHHHRGRGIFSRLRAFSDSFWRIHSIRFQSRGTISRQARQSHTPLLTGSDSHPDREGSPNVKEGKLQPESKKGGASESERGRGRKRETEKDGDDGWIDSGDSEAAEPEASD